MKDWKGNNIEVGQTVMIVNVKSMFAGATMEYYLQDVHGNVQQVGPPLEVKEGYKWEIQSMFFINEEVGTFTICSNGSLGNCSLDALELFFSPQPWQIICIKGISDNQEEYFNELFKVK